MKSIIFFSQNVVAFFSRHTRLAVMLTAFLIGTLYLSQHIIAARIVASEGNKFVPLSFYEPDILSVTGHRFREPLDGHWYVSDPDTVEYKDAPFAWPVATPLLAAPFTFLAAYFFNNPGYAFIIGQGIVAVFSFFLAWFLFFKTIRNKIIAWCGAVILLLYPHLPLRILPENSEELRMLVKAFIPWNFFGYTKDLFYSVWSESFFPGLPVFFGAFVFFVVGVITHRKRLLWCAAFLHGFAFYTYMPNAIYITMCVAVYFFILLMQRNWHMMRTMFVYAGIVAAVSSFFWLNYFELQQVPWVWDIKHRIGFELGSAFRVSRMIDYITYAMIALLAWFFSIKKQQRKTHALFIISCMAAQGIILNLQVFLGYNIMPSTWESHEFYLGILWALVMLLVWAFEDFVKYRRTFLIACVLLTLSLTSRAIITEYEIARVTYKERVLPKEILSAITWLHQNTPRDSVVLTPSFATNALIPLYSHNRVFVPYSMNALASNAEIEERYMTAAALFLYDTTTIAMLFDPLPPLTKELSSDDKMAQYDRFGLYNLFGFTTYDKSIDAFYREFGSNEVALAQGREFRDALVQRYKDRDGNFDNLKKFQVDYVLHGPNEKMFARRDVSALPFLKEVYNQDGISIFFIDHTILNKSSYATR